MLKRQITTDWISNADHKDIHEALRLMEALNESEPKYVQETTKLLYKELRRRQAAKNREPVQTALIFP